MGCCETRHRTSRFVCESSAMCHSNQYSDERERQIQSFSGLRKRNDACCLRKSFGMVETNKLLRRRVVFLSSDNETRRLNEPVIFRFRDFKFAQRRGASRHLRCGTSSRAITYTRSISVRCQNCVASDVRSYAEEFCFERDEVMGSPPLSYERNVSSDARNR